MKNLNYQRYLNRYLDFDEMLWNRSKKSTESGKTRLITNSNNNLHCEYQILDWDSSILGISTARINNIFLNTEPGIEEIKDSLLNIEDVLKKGKIQFAHIRFHMDNFSFWHAFEHYGWYTTDVLNIYAGDIHQILPQTKEILSSIIVSVPSSNEILAFFENNPDLFSHGRIYRDPNIPPEKARRFYQELFLYLFNKPSSIKLTLRHDDKTIGIVIGEPDETFCSQTTLKIGYLWEIGINPAYRGRGYSHILLQNFLEKISPSVKLIEIGTQADNIAANRLYASHGLKLAANAVTLHKWFN